MAITTDAIIDVFGTADTVTSSTSAVTDGSFSVAGDVTTWTNNDDVDTASITFEGTFSVAPDANSEVVLYARLMDAVGTNDNPIPDANFRHTRLGFFPLNDVTSAQYITKDFKLPNGETSQQYEFYIENSAGQTLSAGWDLTVSPKSSAPHS